MTQDPAVFLAEFQKNAETWTRIREQLHRYPELSFQEEKTAAFLSDMLTKWGIEHQTKVGGHGIVAILNGTAPGPCIGLRADMDALPIQTALKTPYASQHNGCMHACGHDVHMTSLLAAIHWLHQHRDLWKGSVKAIFQPGEEKLPGGATYMIEAGVLQEHPRPEWMMALHVAPDLPIGHFGFRSGPYMASTDELYFTLKGTGGHAALPHLLTDPIMAAARLILQLQDIPARFAPPDVPTRLSIGRIDAPGATNVIPAEVKLSGTFRTFDETWRAKAHQHIKDLAKSIGDQHGLTIDAEIVSGYPSLKNDPKWTEQVREKAIHLVGQNAVHDLPIRMTAEDFAWYGTQVPIVFFRLGTSNQKPETRFSVHHPSFDVDPASPCYGGAILSWQILHFLKK